MTTISNIKIQAKVAGKVQVRAGWFQRLRGRNDHSGDL